MKAAVRFSRCLLINFECFSLRLCIFNYLAFSASLAPAEASPLEKHSLNQFIIALYVLLPAPNHIRTRLLSATSCEGGLLYGFLWTVRAMLCLCSLFTFPPYLFNQVCYSTRTAQLRSFNSA